MWQLVWARRIFYPPKLPKLGARTSLACSENEKEESAAVDFFCGLYLQFRDELNAYFQGDISAVVRQNFPKRRFGLQGTIPKVMLDNAASGGEAGFHYSLKYSDGLLRLLWLSVRLRIVAALAFDHESMQEIARVGITPRTGVADFDHDVRTVVFHGSGHTHAEWPREMEFEIDERLEQPFTPEMITPLGRFQPVHSAQVKLNGAVVAEVGWPDNPSVSVTVELQRSNKIQFELDGPPFGSVVLTIRGTLVEADDEQ
jgi:hypothetical protein